MLLWQTKHSGHPNNYWSPVIWLTGGILFFISFTKVDLTNSYSNHRNIIVPAHILFIGLSVLFMLVVGMDLNKVFLDNPISLSGSDVIPSLELYVQRMLAGEKVYTIMDFGNYQVLPTYFPAMWLPYTLPEVLGIDYRWMAFASFFLTYFYISFTVIKKTQSYVLGILFILLPYLMVEWFINYDVSVFAYATELMPITFYIWLMYGLTKKNLWLIAIMLSLCTLSRYAYTFWIIPFVAIIWMELGFSKLLKIGIIGVATILILYVFPFLIWDPTIITDGFAYYSQTMNDQWKVQFWQGAEATMPYHIDQGFSFSYWIYELMVGDHIEKVGLARKIHTSVTLILAIASTFLYKRYKDLIPWNTYLNLILFLYLLVFYALIYVPFSYLFMLPLCIGLALFVLYSEHFLTAKNESID